MLLTLLQLLWPYPDITVTDLIALAVKVRLYRSSLPNSCKYRNAAESTLLIIYTVTADLSQLTIMTAVVTQLRTFTVAAAGNSCGDSILALATVVMVRLFEFLTWQSRWSCSSYLQQLRRPYRTSGNRCYSGLFQVLTSC